MWMHKHASVDSAQEMLQTLPAQQGQHLGWKKEMKEIERKSAFFVETWRFSTQTMQLSI